MTVEIPRNKLVVITGLSGSGKSSLAFDTLYAEGQRRYVESLSAYARQFLELMEKPDVESIEGLSPAISIEQHAPSHNPRSTVGTVTEIYDYLRLLYARVDAPLSPVRSRHQTPNRPADYPRSDELAKDSAVTILAPLIRGRIGIYTELFGRLKKSGYARVRVDGQVHRLEETIKVDRYKKHTIELVVDRVQINEDNRERISDSIETALKESRGLVLFFSFSSQRRNPPERTLRLRPLRAVPSGG